MMHVDFITYITFIHTMSSKSIPTPHLKAIMDKEASGVTKANREAFILQRKKDALNCYLRTACMRVSNDLMFRNDVSE